MSRKTWRVAFVSPRWAPDAAGGAVPELVFGPVLLYMLLMILIAVPLYFTFANLIERGRILEQIPRGQFDLAISFQRPGEDWFDPALIGELEVEGRRIEDAVAANLERAVGPAAVAVDVVAVVADLAALEGAVATHR